VAGAAAHPFFQEPAAKKANRVPYRHPVSRFRFWFRRGFIAVSSRFHRGFAWFRLMVSEGVGETMFFSMISMGETIRNHAYFGGLRFFVPQSCRATCHAGSCMAA
jgi:hypothetical protein